MKNTILIEKNYGSVQMNLRPYMEKLGISRNALARATNTRFEVINKWYEGNVEKVDLNVLARVCYVLECEAGDLLVVNREEEADSGQTSGSDGE